MTPRVLLVDDEEKFIDYLRKRLELRGLKVTVAASGEAALAALESAPQDVVVLDVLMPGMDGIATLRELKRRRPSTEVIMLTGHASVGSAMEGMKLGAYDYLMKPCETDDLVDRIRRACARKSEQEATLDQAGARDA